MLANELRNGNIIKGMYGYSLFDFRNETIVSTLDYYQPMPLDEGWLVMLGFEFDEDESTTKTKIYFDNDFSISIYENVYTLYIADCDECGYGVELKYVHELQNLYFALKKEELTLTINE